MRRARGERTANHHAALGPCMSGTDRVDARDHFYVASDLLVNERELIRLPPDVRTSGGDREGSLIERRASRDGGISDVLRAPRRREAPRLLRYRRMSGKE